MHAHILGQLWYCSDECQHFHSTRKETSHPIARVSRSVQSNSPEEAHAADRTNSGQPQVQTMGMVSMIADGQIQGSIHTMMMMPVAQIADGQIQNMVAPVSVIADGQPQAPQVTAAPVSQIADAQPQAPTAAPVSQIPDAQPQAPTGAAVSQIPDAQPQAPTGTAVSQIPDAQPQAPTGTAVSQIPDAQPQAPTDTPVSQLPDAQPQAPTTAAEAASSASVSAPAASSSAGSTMVACASDSTLALTLADGVLKDAQGRTGYIASNFQFQFDAPPQAGAIYTSGFSVCSNGSLALGGSNVFYQCLSGNFYNLYNENWAAQCSPVTINTLTLITCA